MSKDMKLWKFEGMIKQYDKVLENRIKMETYAVSEKQARNNLAARYKRDKGYVMNTRIDIEGTFTCENI